MSNAGRFHHSLFVIFSWLTTTITIIVTWVTGTFLLVRVLFAILPGAQGSGEGSFSVGVLAVGLSPFISLLGLIPAYFISMKLAEYLRNKHGWELRHPRRLFLLSLVIPVILFLLLTSLSHLNPKG